MLTNAQHDPALSNELREIEIAARTAAESLRRIQDYSSPPVEQEMVPLDLNTVVNETVQLTRYRWRDDAEASGIVIDVIRDLADVPPVLGSRAELRDALVELILNAVEAMPLGGVVTVRTERLGDGVRVSVTDIGEGMEPATRTRAFDSFFTTKGAGHVGLGLQLASEIATRHRGSLQIESTPARVTMVTVSLPATNVRTAAPAMNPTVPERGMKILVVDDDPSLREIAGKSLALHGHQVVTA